MDTGPDRRREEIQATSVGGRLNETYTRIPVIASVSHSVSNCRSAACMQAPLLPPPSMHVWGWERTEADRRHA